MNIAPIARWGQAAVFEKAANGIVEIHAHLEAVEMEVLEQVVTSRLHSRLWLTDIWPSDKWPGSSTSILFLRLRFLYFSIPHSFRWKLSIFRAPSICVFYFKSLHRFLGCFF